jgi:hypothetical protein
MSSKPRFDGGVVPVLAAETAEQTVSYILQLAEHTPAREPTTADLCYECDAGQLPGDFETA